MIYCDLQNLVIPKNHDGIYLNVVTSATGVAPIDSRRVNLTFGGIDVYNNSTFQPLREGNTSYGWMHVVFIGIGTPVIKDRAYANGSIIEWVLNASSTSSGLDTVSATGDIDVGTTESIFKIFFGDSALSDITTDNVFWNTFGGSQAWSMPGLFGQAFTSGAFRRVASNQNGSHYGSSTLSGGSHTSWSLAAGNVIQSGSTYTPDSTSQSVTLDSAITGANTTILSATNTYTGDTTVSAGTWALSSSDSITTTTLSATNTYTDDTTVSEGTWAPSSSGSITNSTSIAMAPEAILDGSAVPGTWTVGAVQSLTGGGGVTGATSLAPANVIYSDLKNLAIPKNTDGIYLNVLTGATGVAPFDGWHVNLTFGGINVYNNSTFQPLRTGGTGIDTLRNIATGGLISSVSTHFATGLGVSFDHLGSTFTAGSEGYIGFSVNNGSTNYGWMRVVLTGTGTPVIKDWAYDASGASLAAGNVIQSGSTYTLDSTSQSFTLDSAITGANSVIKIGANTTTLSATNTYTGNTTVSTGTLALGSSGSITNSTSIAVASGAILDVSAVSGNWTVGAAQTLTGGGGVTGHTTIAGTHNAGNSGVGSQAIAGNLSYANGSIFEWDLNASSTSSGFDTVSATGDIVVGTTGTVFKIIFGATALSDITTGNAFWNTVGGSQTWSMTDIFGKAFTSGAFQSVATHQDVSHYGSFTISGSSLTWTTVPEPTSALVAILLGAGGLRRRR